MWNARTKRRQLAIYYLVASTLSLTETNHVVVSAFTATARIATKTTKALSLYLPSIQVAAPKKKNCKIGDASWTALNMVKVQEQEELAEKERNQGSTAATANDTDATATDATKAITTSTTTTTTTPFFDPLGLSTMRSGSQKAPPQSTTPLPLSLEPSSSALGLDKDEPGKTQLSLWDARWLLLLVAAIWGTNFASVKYLEGLCFHPPCHHPPSEFALARFGVAALVSLPLLWKQNLRVIMAGLECGLSITLGYVTQALALATIPSGECAFICSLTVVFVPIAAAVLYGKPIQLVNVAAAALALAGVGILEGMVDLSQLIPGLVSSASAATETATVAADAASALASSSAVAAVASGGAAVEAALTTAANNVMPAISFGPLDSLAKMLGVETGDILALGQPIGFGYTFLRIEHYQEQFKNVPNRVLTIAAAQCVCVGVLSLLWVLYDFHGTLPDFGYLMEPHRIATILWTGIVTTVIAIFLEGVALQKASATDASIAFSSEPVWASLFGFLLLREQLGLNSYVGGSVIMTACLIGALSDLKKEDQDKELEQFAP